MKSIRFRINYQIVVVTMWIACVGCIRPIGTFKQALENASQQVSEVTGNTRFTLQDFTVHHIDLFTLDVSGTLTGCEYEVKSYDRVRVTSGTAHYPVPIFNSHTSEVERNQKTYWLGWMPSVVSVRTPFGNITAPVSASGLFRFTLRSAKGEEEYMQPPPDRSGYHIVSQTKSLYVVPESSPADVRFDPRVLGEISVWYYNKDVSK